MTAVGRNIILIGFMGSGKTTVGRRLSYRLRMSVDDTDKIIERRQGMSISEIFAKYGEDAFRSMETELLDKICNQEYAHIYSVGGGTPIRTENRALLKKCGTVVYLRARPETIYERIKDDNTRPLLQCDDPLKRIRELMSDRRSAYEECADLIVDVDDIDVEIIMEQIAEGLRKLGIVGVDDDCKSGLSNRREEVRDGMKPKKILVINGPNINFLGIREKSVYGTQDYEYLLNMIEQKGAESGSEITVFQSNHEGAIIDRIQESYFDGTEGIVINPGAYTHYSYAIRDALASITVPKVEIHISDITKREEFRKNSVTKDACDHQIYGQGLDGYLQAIDFILNFQK